MPLFDKLKAQAAEVAQRTQEAGKLGQSKIADVQTHRQADSLFRDLGQAVFASRSGRGDAGNEAEIDRIVGALVQLEREHGPLIASATGSDASTATGPDVTPAPASSAAGAGGDIPTSTIPVANSIPTAVPSEASEDRPSGSDTPRPFPV